MEKSFVYLYMFYTGHLLAYIIIYSLNQWNNSTLCLVHTLLLYATITYEVQYVHNVLMLYSMFKKLNSVLEKSIASCCSQREEAGSHRRYALWQVCDMHWTLCQSVEHRINGNYNFRLLGIIVILFLALLQMPFLIAVNLFNSRLQNALVYTVWFSLHVLQLLAIAYSCAYTTDEANNTKNIVCEYLTPRRSRDLIKQLKIIESQLSAHKVNFDAAGIFELDRSFVAWMVGAITTYLVIFIQLQESSVWNIPKTAIW